MHTRVQTNTITGNIAPPNPDKYIGKSLKYLSIFDKTLKRSACKDNVATEFSIDTLVDILTPSKLQDIPPSVVVDKLSDRAYNEIVSGAKSQFEKIILNLQTNYWNNLKNVAMQRKTWTAYQFIAEVLKSGNDLASSRSCHVMYQLLIDLFVTLNVLRNVGDSIDHSVNYVEFDYEQ